jgi:Cu/Ag efflux pump CusA
MMRGIIRSSLRARRLMVALAVGLLILGFSQLRGMPRDVLPEFTPPTVEVQTEALGLSAEEVEQFITVPLEQDLLNGVAFLDQIRSASVPGLSSIQMVFEPGTDLLKARQVVQERLSQAQVALPGVQSRPPQMLQPLSSTSRVMLIGLSSADLSTIDMSILARWTITPRLLGVPGVANVAVWGNRDRQLQVLVDPARLRERGVSLQQIVETTANAQFVSPLTFTEASTPGTGGILETPNQRLGVQHRPVFATAADLASVPIEGADDKPLVLGDVAEVVEDHQPLIGDAIGPGLLLVIEKFPAANTVEVTRGVEEALEALRPGLSGVAIDSSIYRAATFVETSSRNLLWALLVGGVLAILLFGALAFEWRTTLIAAISLVVSLAVAVTVLSLTQASLNSMVLAGLTLGLVVVVVEAILDVSNLATRLQGDETVTADRVPATTVLLEAAIEMRSAAAYAALIALVALVPTLFTKGPFGAFFPSIGVSFAVAILASMVVALVVTPALALLMLSKSPESGRRSPILRWVGPRYEEILSRFIGSPRPAYVAAGIVVLAGVLTLPFLERSPVPSFKDTNVLIQLSGAPGTSLQEMDRITARIAEEVRAIPGIDDVGAHAGRAVLSDQVVGSNASEVWVNVAPGADYDAAVGSIQEVIHGYPGLDRRMVTYPQQRIEEVLSGTQSPIEVRVYGPDLDILRTKAEEVRHILATIDGVVDPVVGSSAEEPTVEIEVDLSSAQRYGIKPGDVRRAATTLLSGIRVGSLFEEQKVFEVVVWGTPGVRNDASSINALLIDTPAGRQVRLGDVADVRIAPAPEVIRHDAVSRYVDVSAGVAGRSPGEVTADVERALQRVQFPLEYHVEVLDEFAERRAAGWRVLVLSAFAAIGIFVLLQAAFASWRLSTLAFLMLALGLLGGAIGAWAGGGVVSLGSISGFFAVLWVAARQTIYSIKRYPTRSEQDGERFDRTLIVRSAGECLSPMLISTIAALGAMVPLVVVGEIAGLEVVHPMALVVIGGLLASALLNLFVLPALYLRFAPRPEAAIPLTFVEPVLDLTKHEPVELTGRKDGDAAP